MAPIDNLTRLWNVLERRGCTVDRLDTEAIDHDTYLALVAEAEWRLRVLAEADLPGPAEHVRPPTEALVSTEQLERLIVLVASALTDSPKVHFLRDRGAA